MPERDRLAEQPDRVRERIEASRNEAIDAFLRIRERLRFPYDWRGAVRRAPALALLGGFVAGFALARLSSRERDER